MSINKKIIAFISCWILLSSTLLAVSFPKEMYLETEEKSIVLVENDYASVKNEFTLADNSNENYMLLGDGRPGSDETTGGELLPISDSLFAIIFFPALYVLAIKHRKRKK